MRADFLQRCPFVASIRRFGQYVATISAQGQEQLCIFSGKGAFDDDMGFAGRESIFGDHPAHILNADAIERRHLHKGFALVQTDSDISRAFQFLQPQTEAVCADRSVHAKHLLASFDQLR